MAIDPNPAGISGLQQPGEGKSSWARARVAGRGEGWLYKSKGG
jgi:hypothetical protein